MEKTFFEKKIDEMAEELFNKEFEQIYKLFHENKIVQMLKLKFDKNNIALLDDCCPSESLFPQKIHWNRQLPKYSNFDEIKEKRIQEIKLELIKKLFDQIGILKDFLDGKGIASMAQNMIDDGIPF